MTTYRSKKREAGNYEVVSSDGTVVATIVLTGRPGVDNYPWDYAIVDERAADHGRMFGVTDTKAAALDKIRTMLAAADAAHTVPDIGSRVRLNNPDSNLDGTNGTVTHHRTFNGHTLVGVRLDDTEYSVGCSLDELQPLDKAVRA